MSDHLPGSHERTTQWQHIYETNETDAVSWYRSEPVVSLELIDLLGMAPEAGTIDVGGGASIACEGIHGYRCAGHLPGSAASLSPTSR